MAVKVERDGMGCSAHVQTDSGHPRDGVSFAHARVDGHGTEQAAQNFTAGVDFDRDVLAQDFEEVSKPITAQFIGMGINRGHRLGLKEVWQLGLDHANGQIDVLQAKTNQARLARQRLAEVWSAASHKNVHIARTKGHPFELDVVNDREVIGDI